MNPKERFLKKLVGICQDFECEVGIEIRDIQFKRIGYTTNDEGITKKSVIVEIKLNMG